MGNAPLVPEGLLIGHDRSRRRSEADTLRPAPAAVGPWLGVRSVRGDRRRLRTPLPVHGLRLATYHRTHGVRYFPGRCSIGGDTLWSVNHGKKSTASMPAAPKSNPCRPRLLAAVEADGGEGSDLRVREYGS